jgi:hypothetical protein
MPIPPEHATRCLYHFTHIDNLKSILQHGLLANTHTSFAATSARSIAASTIQERRAAMRIPPASGGVVHDYVPLYFGSLSLMLLGVINKKNVDQCDILYFEFPISILNKAGAIFTDASANTAIPPNFFDDTDQLTQLNWSEIDSIKWSSKSKELQHERMAEALIPPPLALQDAARIVVWSNETRLEVTRIAAECGAVLPPIAFESRDRRHFFCKFKNGEDGETLVIGPRNVAAIFEEACLAISSLPQGQQCVPFSSLQSLLESLRVNFGSIPQTAELIGLKSENGVHKLTVDLHTQAVVAKLINSPEFAALDPTKRDIVELATYLHDIGKGPKSRWATNGGVQAVDPDHPVKAMPMMVDIFRDFIRSWTAEDAKILTKLVCYHDLVGEVLGKDRDEQQIYDVVSNQTELRMLFAIGKADATSLVEHWWNDAAATALRSRCVAAISGQK